LKQRTAHTILVTILAAVFLASMLRIAPVNAPAGGSVLVVPSIPYPNLAAAVALALPNDEIHVAPGWIEILPPGGLTIWQNNLWIIGGPSGLGATPVIDLAGPFSITIAASGVFIWGLNIIDSSGTSSALINLAPPSASCLIMNNIITGLAPPNVGIVVQGTNNIVTLNTISTCGICILVTAPSTTNVVKLNTINLPNFIGIQVSGGPGTVGNSMYWNNIWASPEFDDATPGTPLNYFDDTSTPGGPSFGEGNWWAFTLPPPYIPFPIPGLGGNGWLDFFPRAGPIAQLQGDANVNGLVDIFDIVLLAKNFGQIWCQLGWDPRADLNGDGLVDIMDIVRVAVNFSAHY
jgi:hypothetical protein